MPLVDVVLSTDGRCPAGSELLMSREWGGTNTVCVEYDTIFGWRYWQSYCPRHNDDGHVYRELSALDPVLQTKFDGVTVCGVRGGQSFMEQTRAQKNGMCPQGTAPCSNVAHPDNIVCLPWEDHKDECPLTFFDIMRTDDAMKKYKGKSGYKIMTMTYDMAIVTGRQTDSMPITSIRIDN